MSDQALQLLTRRLKKCPFDNTLFSSESDLAFHLAQRHFGQLFSTARIARNPSETEHDRPSKVYTCSHCRAFVVPELPFRNAISEIADHIRTSHQGPNGTPAAVSLSYSSDPAIIDQFMADQDLEDVCVCRSNGCTEFFANEESIVNHWAEFHADKPSLPEVQAAIAEDPERFAGDLKDILAQLAAADDANAASHSAASDDGYQIRRCPSVPRIRSRPGEFIVYVQGDSFRVSQEDIDELARLNGSDLADDQDPSIPWDPTTLQSAKLELRFCNILDGFIPLVKPVRMILPRLADGEQIDLSWQDSAGDSFPCTVSKSKRAIYHPGGKLKDLFRQLPAGIYLYLHRIGPRRYHLQPRREPRLIPNCKFFVRDAAGRWQVEIREAHVEWECSPEIFRHQLTFADMEALFAEAENSGLSVRDAVHDVMRLYAQNGPLHIRAVYDIVFLLLRTCSLTAVWSQFRPEHTCYKRVMPGANRFDPNGALPQVRFTVRPPRLVEEPSYPPRAALEVPLLRAIIAMGGSIIFSSQGRALEVALAQEFRLPDEIRDFASPRYHSQGHRKWRNHLQFVKDDLVKLGHIDASQRDTWQITAAGRERAHSTST